MENVKKYEGVNINDIVFEYRNKAYGAYAIRSTENERVKQSFLFLIVFIFIMAYIPKVFGYFKSEDIKDKIEVFSDLTEVNIIPEKKVEPIVPKKEFSKMPEKMIAANTEYKVVSDKSKTTDTLLDNKQLAMAEIGKNNQIGGSTTGCTDCLPTMPDIPKAEVKKEIVVIENKPIDFAQVMPEYIGGEAALSKYLSANLVYPRYELENVITGKTIVRFVVNESGKVTELEIARSGGKNFDKEALRVMRSIGDFKPGVQAGQKVKVRMMIPIIFDVQ